MGQGLPELTAEELRRQGKKKGQTTQGSGQDLDGRQQFQRRPQNGRVKSD